MASKPKLDGSVTLRLTPYQSRKLRPLFRAVAEAVKAGKRGILAAQLYAPNDFVHGHGRKDHAVARVGFLRHELAVKMRRSVEGKSEKP